MKHLSQETKDFIGFCVGVAILLLGIGGCQALAGLSQ